VHIRPKPLPGESSFSSKPHHFRSFPLPQSFFSIRFGPRLKMISATGLVAACYTLLLSSRAVTYAAPLDRNGVEPSQSSFTTTLSPRAEDFYLRLMPLGASITRGDPADPDDPDENGYRKFLRDRLRFDGWEVNMVGSVSSWGNMNDRVSQISPPCFRRYRELTDFSIRTMKAGPATRSPGSVRKLPQVCPSTSPT
jgi:hypothetical protein